MTAPVDPLVTLIAALQGATEHELSSIAAGILAASHLGIAQDSRSFARKLDLAHALVLRECVALAEDLNLIDLDDRQDKSQRLFFSLTEKAKMLIAETVT